MSVKKSLYYRLDSLLQSTPDLRLQIESRSVEYDGVVIGQLTRQMARIISTAASLARVSSVYPMVSAIICCQRLGSFLSKGEAVTRMAKW